MTFILLYYLASSSESPSLLSTPRCSETSTDYEPSKQCGRKRKQYAPRKLVSTSSSSASPEEVDVDVCTVRESPEEKFGRVSQGDEGYGTERMESPFERRELSFEQGKSPSTDKMFKEQSGSPRDEDVFRYRNGEHPENNKFNFSEGELPRDKYNDPHHPHKYVQKQGGESPRELFGGRSPLMEKIPLKERPGGQLAEKFMFRDSQRDGDSPLAYEGITPTNRSHQKLDDLYLYR